MKFSKSIVSLSLAGVLCATGNLAHASAWMDFDDAAVGGTGISSDSSNPTILNQVTVVCPSSGYLVARSSSTAFMRNLIGTKSTGFVFFSISRDTRSDNTYKTIALENLGPNTYTNMPAGLQRIEACNSGETRTYYHTAHGFAGSGNQVAIEGRSRLVVEFFDKRI